MSTARQIKPAERRYSGGITDPERWDGFAPRAGDVILSTPAKSGTTWTQSMIAMLFQGSSVLPNKLSFLSPWIESNMTPREVTEARFAAQAGRRVIKTHTPCDGWPVWADVSAVFVFRHPMEVFHSIRKHLANSKVVGEHPYLEDTDTALAHFLEAEVAEDAIDRDSVATIVRFFETSVLSDRWPRKLVLHYAAMSRDHAGTVARLNDFLGTRADAALQAEITAATSFGAMKQNAADFAPEVANDMWHDDQAFFAGGRSGTWAEGLTDTQIDAYRARFAELLPDAAHRHWIETGEGDV